MTKNTSKTPILIKKVNRTTFRENWQVLRFLQHYIAISKKQLAKNYKKILSAQNISADGFVFSDPRYYIKNTYWGQKSMTFFLFLYLSNDRRKRYRIQWSCKKNSFSHWKSFGKAVFDTQVIKFAWNFFQGIFLWKFLKTAIPWAVKVEKNFTLRCWANIITAYKKIRILEKI